MFHRRWIVSWNILWAIWCTIVLHEMEKIRFLLFARFTGSCMEWSVYTILLCNFYTFNERNYNEKVCSTHSSLFRYCCRCLVTLSAFPFDIKTCLPFVQYITKEQWIKHCHTIGAKYIMPSGKWKISNDK